MTMIKWMYHKLEVISSNCSMFYLLFLARCRGNSKIWIVQVAYCQIQCLFKYNYIIQKSTKTVFEDRRTET